MDQLSISDLHTLLRSRPGLIVGPALTLHPGTLQELADAIETKFQIESDDNFLVAADKAVEKDNNEAAVVAEVNAFITGQKPSAVLSHLADGRWSAIISASYDTNFEAQLQHTADQRPNRKPITTITDFKVPLPPRTLPVFKLLGASGREGLAVTSTQYAQKRAGWRHVIPKFAERVQGSFVLVLGLSDYPPLMVDLIAEIQGSDGAIPRSLIFLHDDPLARSSQIQSLLTGRLRGYVLRGAISDVIQLAADAERSGYHLPATVVQSDDDAPYASLRAHQDLVAIVNEQLSSNVSSDQRQRLLDLLFAPSVTRWDAYAHDLDFRRTISNEFVKQIEQEFRERKSKDPCVLIKGTSASGKTTALKRIAFDLAALNHLVLWIRPNFAPDPRRAFRRMFADIGALRLTETSRVILILDDFVKSSMPRIQDIVAAARAEEVRITLIVTARSTDWSSIDPSEYFGEIMPTIEESVPDHLDDSEWKSLPEYLVKIGICHDLEKAAQECSLCEHRSAHDTLSMLYWLLPATRTAIASAVRDEYFQLGDLAGFRRVLLGATEHTTSILKRAYEMVAVADHYGAPLPIEVLVSALQLDYQPWLDMAKSGSPAWGVLYADEDEEGGTIYRTRNSLVTQMIVEAINCGVLGHAGELSVLTQLIRGCTGKSSSVYREFCVKVLVPAKSLEHLEYDEGLLLYNEAIEALPLPDKTLEHQKGLWIKNAGRDPVEATKVLEAALSTPLYPYAERGEADQHIHTSIAATTLDAIDRGEISLDEGKDKAIEHLSKARSKDYFNPRAVHVQGNLILRLSQKFAEGHIADAFALINQAVADIDRTMIVLGNPVRMARATVGDIKMLEQMREHLYLSVSNIPDLEAEAERLWSQFSRQDGFVLCARKYYEQAVASNRGTRFKNAYEYCQHVRKKVQDAGHVPIAGIAEAELLILYRWRVTRAIFNKLESEIDWNEIEKVARQALRSPNAGDNPLYSFILALACAHLSNWSEANSIFYQLRKETGSNDLLWTPRAFMLDAKGSAKLFQGTIHTGAARDYFHVEELHNDFPLDRCDNWPADGEVAHAYISMAFAGPTAVSSLN
jgi:hypothetical protein